MAEVLGPSAPVGDDAISPSVDSSESDGLQDLALDDPVLKFGVSLGGEDERMLYYYAGQVRTTPNKFQNSRRGGAGPIISEWELSVDASFAGVFGRELVATTRFRWVIRSILPSSPMPASNHAPPSVSRTRRRWP